MKLVAFQSDKGDCLLLEANGARMLIDGGMPRSYSLHVAPTLGRIREDSHRLDVVYVSHIDQDHIGGVLRMLDDELDWRVHDFQLASGNDQHPEPESPRPPEIGDVWHNGFSELVEQNAGEIEDLLAARASTLGAGESSIEQAAAGESRELALSVPEGIRLSHRLSAEQLGIPLNRAFGEQLAMVRSGNEPVELGGMKLTALGPTEEDLDRLRKEWDGWLAKERTNLEKLRGEMAKDVERLASGDVVGFHRGLIARAGELADRGEVTVPNLASLMFLVEEGERTILLTGDGHARDVERGLEQAGKLDDEGRIHVDVLKIPHHGSEHNLDAQFCGVVSADHYVYCADGSHKNPDLVRLEELIASRLGSGDSLNPSPRAAAPFKLWVNSSSTSTHLASNKGHMEEVEEIVESAAASSEGRMSFEFLDEDSFEIEL